MTYRKSRSRHLAKKKLDMFSATTVEKVDITVNRATNSVWPATQRTVLGERRFRSVVAGAIVETTRDNRQEAPRFAMSSQMHSRGWKLDPTFI